MPVKDRIGKLRALLQSAEKTRKTEGQDAYKAEAQRLYGLLRETWGAADHGGAPERRRAAVPP
jgi:hypothetical protein